MNWQELWNYYSQLKSASTNRVTVEMSYIDICNDLNSGILLSQIVYWYLPNKKGKSKLRVLKQGEYWLAKSYDEWYNETRLKKKQVMRAVKILTDLDLIASKVFRFNGLTKVHYQLKIENFINKLSSELEKYKPEEFPNGTFGSAQNALAEVMKMPLNKGQKCISGSAQKALPITVTTTDTTKNYLQKEKGLYSNNTIFGWVSDYWLQMTGSLLKRTKPIITRFKTLSHIEQVIIQQACVAFLNDDWRKDKPKARTFSVLFKSESSIYEWSGVYIDIVNNFKIETEKDWNRLLEYIKPFSGDLEVGLEKLKVTSAYSNNLYLKSSEAENISGVQDFLENRLMQKVKIILAPKRLHFKK